MNSEMDECVVYTRGKEGVVPVSIVCVAGELLTMSGKNSQRYAAYTMEFESGRRD